jgi:hypothetical protein
VSVYEGLEDPGSRRGKAVRRLDSAWGQGIVNSDQFVQIVYLTL